MTSERFVLHMVIVMSVLGPSICLLSYNCGTGMKIFSDVLCVRETWGLEVSSLEAAADRALMIRFLAQ
jgi:hypothetical protein